MGVFDAFETDKKAEKDGVWFDYPANKDGTIPRVRLARMARSNPRYVSKLEELQRKYKVELNHDMLNNEKAEKPLLEAFCETIMLEWEHVQNREGVEIPFEDRMRTLEALPAWYDMMREQAQGLEAYKAQENKVAAGE